MDYQSKVDLIKRVFTDDNQFEEFMKLAKIGGCKKYHQEGNALIHTIMAMDYCHKNYEFDCELLSLCMLHDIGKIYSSIEKDGDWSYPNHAKIGAENLYKFVSPEDKDFQKIQWYIANHIKPLFWKEKGITVTLPIPEGCTLDKLRKLAICDLQGSIPDESEKENQKELIKYLIKLII